MQLLMMRCLLNICKKVSPVSELCDISAIQDRLLCVSVFLGIYLS